MKNIVENNKQYNLSQRVVMGANVNIVTCGMCGDVMLHDPDDVELTCPYCDFVGEPCDFPDLFLEKH